MESETNIIENTRNLSTNSVFDGNVNINGGNIIIDGGSINIIESPKNKKELILSLAQNLYMNTAFDQTKMSPKNIAALCVKRAEEFADVAKKLEYI